MWVCTACREPEGRAQSELVLGWSSLPSGGSDGASSFCPFARAEIGLGRRHSVGVGFSQAS